MKTCLTLELGLPRQDKPCCQTIVHVTTLRPTKAASLLLGTGITFCIVVQGPLRRPQPIRKWEALLTSAGSLADVVRKCQMTFSCDFWIDFKLVLAAQMRNNSRNGVQSRYYRSASRSLQSYRFVVHAVRSIPGSGVMLFYHGLKKLLMAPCYCT